MNIFQTVIDSVQASAADIVDAGGIITITGLSRPIPKAGIVSARRVVVGEKPQIYTIAVGTPASNVTYQISVTGKSVVTGIIKTWTANYTTGTTAPSAAALGTALVAAMTYSDAPFTVSGSSTITITAKSGTPNITVVSSNATTLPVVNATAGLATAGSACAISTSGVVSGTGTAYTAQLPVGAAFYAANNAGTVALTGYVSGNTSDTVGQVVPNPNATLTSATPIFASGIYLVDNTGATIENTYAYANLPGVTLTAGNRYVVYEIDALDRLTVGNGARPDGILMKYVIYVNGGDTDVWKSSNGTGTGGFDAALATACNLSSF